MNDHDLITTVRDPSPMYVRTRQWSRSCPQPRGAHPAPGSA